MADWIVMAEEADWTPNWDKWRLIPEAAPWKCVALSLNIDPDWLRHHGNYGCPVESKDFKDFDNRYDVVMANAYGALNSGSDAIDLREFAAWVRRIGWDAPAELLAMTDKQVAIKSGKRTDPATATRAARKTDRLEALKRFIEHVYEVLDKAGHEIGQSGDRTPLPVSADDLHTLFLVRHPEHMVAQSTFNDDLGTIATVKPGPKRYEIKELAEMLAGKFSVD
ncbi:MAG: hypothetical protein LC647_04130 [Beggiatoa sp.]|nr:hypothetical protein [Beggiatoa sp.]